MPGPSEESSTCQCSPWAEELPRGIPIDELQNLYLTLGEIKCNSYLQLQQNLNGLAKKSRYEKQFCKPSDNTTVPAPRVMPWQAKSRER